MTALYPHLQRPSRTPVAVAVGIVFNAQGQFLLTTRPKGKVYAGYWEFPGGKLEIGETVVQALARELHEEIGITVATERLSVWRNLLMDYPHALVNLQFVQIPALEWSGELHMKEAQTYCWQSLPVTVSPLLPGAVPVLEWLTEPTSRPSP